MRPIIIGAGRGSRLQHRTDEIPKTLVDVMGRPMLDWILEALGAAGFSSKDVIFISGYAQDVVKSRYPEFTYVENRNWAHNNILASLMCAEHLQSEGFVSTYADIVYEGAIVKRLVENPEDFVLGCDTEWRRRYIGRTEHPESDAEKMRAQGGRVLEVSRHVPSETAYGEFIGVMKVSPAGARALAEAYNRARQQFAGREFREGRTFEKAYLIDLLQTMIEGGYAMHHEDTAGGYMELDTLQDLAAAQRWWSSRP